MNGFYFTCMDFPSQAFIIQQVKWEIHHDIMLVLIEAEKWEKQNSEIF